MNDFRKLKVYGFGTIGPKGQVVIPANARKELNLNTGERVVVMNMPHQDGIMIVNEKEFNKKLEYLRDHFQDFDEFVDQYNNDIKRDVQK